MFGDFKNKFSALVDFRLEKTNFHRALITCAALYNIHRFPAQYPDLEPVPAHWLDDEPDDDPHKLPAPIQEHVTGKQ
jgi:hypothetical protein